MSNATPARPKGKGRGAEHGYIYHGAINSYLVTMLELDRKGGTALVQIKECLTSEATIPAGAKVRVPLSSCEVN